MSSRNLQPLDIFFVKRSLDNSDLDVLFKSFTLEEKKYLFGLVMSPDLIPKLFKNSKKKQYREMRRIQKLYSPREMDPNKISILKKMVKGTKKNLEINELPVESFGRLHEDVLGWVFSFLTPEEKACNIIFTCFQFYSC